jgi:energy-coupling factor transporter ATP-binding protein EcfA2
MAHIRKIESNVKKGYTGEIGEKTLVIGVNGSGKSSIVNAVELALTGRASDIAGRTDVGREVDLMSLAKDGAENLYAMAEFDDGKRATFHTSGTTAKAKKATVERPGYVQHDDVLPIRTVREAILGSPVTARKFLLRKVAGDVSRDDLLAYISENVQDLFKSFLGMTAASIPTPDVLVAALEHADKKMREANAEAKAAKAAATAITGGAATPPSKAEIKSAKDARDTARKMVAEIEAVASRGTNYDAAKAEAEKAEDALNPLLDALTAAQAALDALPAPDAREQTLVPVLATAKASVEAGACLVCGSEDAAVISGSVSAIESFLSDAGADRAKRQAAEATFAKVKREAEAALARVERAEQRLNDLTATESAPAESMTLEAAQAALAKADATLLDLQTTANAWDAARKAQGRVQDAERQSADWSVLKGDLTVALGSVLDNALAAFIAKVQASLPATDVFDLRLKDGDREVVQFGLVRGDRLHTALSGAEWARVLAALSEACVADDAYAVVIPEERAFDPKTLADVMGALTTCRHQVILTSPVAPATVPEGWTVIERVKE